MSVEKSEPSRTDFSSSSDSIVHENIILAEDASVASDKRSSLLILKVWLTAPHPQPSAPHLMADSWPGSRSWLDFSFFSIPGVLSILLVFSKLIIVQTCLLAAAPRPSHGLVLSRDSWLLISRSFLVPWLIVVMPRPLFLLAALYLHLEWWWPRWVTNIIKFYCPRVLPWVLAVHALLSRQWPLFRLLFWLVAPLPWEFVLVAPRLEVPSTPLWRTASSPSLGSPGRSVFHGIHDLCYYYYGIIPAQAAVTPKQADCHCPSTLTTWPYPHGSFVCHAIWLCWYVCAHLLRTSLCH